jgi:hypothetical protein
MCLSINQDTVVRPHPPLCPAYDIHASSVLYSYPLIRLDRYLLKVSVKAFLRLNSLSIFFFLQ